MEGNDRAISIAIILIPPKDDRTIGRGTELRIKSRAKGIEPVQLQLLTIEIVVDAERDSVVAYFA